MNDHPLDGAAAERACAGAPRCRWCGLVIPPDDTDATHERPLCRACASILGDADWQALLHHSGEAAARAPEAKPGDGRRWRKAAKG